MFWHTTRFRIDLSSPKVMGIVNVTPDSFSDGGSHADAQSALVHCEQLLKEGADILDIGGESSRPGAPTLSVEEEWARVGPVLQGALSLGVPISVDTCKTQVMQRALDLGVDIINDIRALQAPGAESVVVAHGQCGVCLMHMQGDPSTMQFRPQYSDVIDEVRTFLQERVQAMVAQSVARDRLCLDPGIGFGKTPQHNLDLLRRQSELLSFGLPLLVGWSRKSTLGHVTGRPVGDRLAASLAAALASVHQGAKVVRVHDVAATVDALKVWSASEIPPNSWPMAVHSAPQSITLLTSNRP
ncbi:dihydropteroate synthase [Aquabacterium sp.]|uniref:dihydropteroate synthase n=1 Tax=Aquabacterium sp. TaxID=1872578 RepID=UPI00248A682F|nr:dihydropteroate synthase [Aquabacterium sp.]MDI1259180.1 dihydropteroate synthase [Aquabacterium sp.]